MTGREGFGALLHAEWTKLRTVPGWVIGLPVAGLLIVLVALLAGISSDQRGAPPVPTGPGGEPVTDSFSFVHRPLTGDGSITVSVSSLTTGVATVPGELGPGTVPWAKAGLVLKQSARQGSPYAAIMVTGSHGVRLQSDYVNDVAGPSGPVSEASIRLLRLDRSGDAVTGYASTDGTHWSKVGTVRVGLGPAPLGGLFVASPPAVRGMGTVGTVATATFADLRLQGRWAGGDWVSEQLGAESPTFAGYPAGLSSSFTASGGRFTVTGAGDLAPAVRETLPTGGTRGDILTGTFPALITVAVVGALYITTEYRRRMIRLTFAASPRRGRVLLAKAIVLGAVAFVVGAAGALVAGPLGERLSEAHGVFVFPVPSDLAVALGTGVLLATASILALSVGAVIRNGAGAVTTVVVVVVLPYLLIANPFMPENVANWLARVTPAAGFAVQQTLVQYPQVTASYRPYNGYYPLAPWAGLAVLAGYAAAGLAVAVVALRRRDA